MFKRLLAFPKWTILPGAVIGVALLNVLLFSYRGSLTASSTVSASTISEQPDSSSTKDATISGLEEPVTNIELGTRHQLTYDQWVKLLTREAAVMADKAPEQLYILAGDSLSLWFPVEELPAGVTWLNQGISGETSYGLLRRVKFLDQTKPRVIFLMIGINDLIRGMRYETVAANHREIIRHLKSAHPKAMIVVQSILPHGGDRATQRYLASIKDDPAPEQNPPPAWVKKLPVITNPSIQRLNKRLALIAQEEKVEFLDLHPQFADAKGYLRDDLTTDGLHLSSAGYALWRSHLEAFLPKAPQARISR